jgi:iron complex outermembrane receptor protein
VKRALACGAIAALGAGTLVAYATPAPTPKAQATTAPAAQNAAAAPASLQTIIVTGTLIPRPASQTAEAITIIKARHLRNLGVVNVEQAVDQVTSNVAAPINIAQSVGEFTGGGTFANLRDLGIGRTLVLLDGHRLADNVSIGSAVDLSGIPFSAIQNVQVLREGASAIYGSDAIAGVINFVTKRSYQGAEVNVDLDHPQEPGGSSADVDFTAGYGSLARNGYNIMFTGSYSKQDSLIAAQRSFARTGFNPALGLANVNGPTGTTPGSYTDANGNLWQVGYPQCAGNPELAVYQGSPYLGDCEYLYSAVVDLLPPSSEASGLLQITKTLPDNNKLRLQYFYTQSKVVDWGGPQTFSFEMTPQADPTYFPTAAESTCYGNVVVGGNCTAAPDLTQPIVVGWTDAQNNRYTEDLNTEQRALLTFSGHNDGWTYTASLNYSKNTTTESTVGGYANYSVLAPTTDPNTGNQILSNLINPFGPQTAAGNALINSSYLNGVYDIGSLQHWGISAHASHRLGDAFHSGHSSVLAVGFSAHEDRINTGTTPLAVPLYSALLFSPTSVVGSRNDEAIFAELYVPMSSHFEATISDREDRYSDFGETNNSKLALRYQPSRYITFRATASTGFRAPTLTDLYSPDILGATGGTMGASNPDCVAPSYDPPEFTKTVCTSQGLALYGGNRNLKPETSQNFDVGIIVEPITNLGITLDYYRINISNALGGVPYGAIYENPSEFSSYYHLTSTGTLSTAANANTQCPTYTASTCGYVLQLTTNTGGLTTDGFDLSVEYMKQTPIGTFRLHLRGTLITHFELQEYSGGPEVNLLGWYNQGNEPAIRWQHNLEIDWTNPNGNWSAGIENHFLSHYIDENPTATGAQRIVGDQSTWDVYASYRPIRPLTVLFGIRNVFNQVPPFSNQVGNWPAGYNPIFSNPIMRDFYLNLSYRFGT